ncbi:MAG: hypothetical protein ACPICC_04520, partial [Candidatus Puniceispirillaceae bacterium]
WRLLGIGVSVARVEKNASNLFAEEEAELFEEQRDAHKERKDKLEEAIDHVRARLGAEAVKTGRRFSFEARTQKQATKNMLQTDKNR